MAEFHTVCRVGDVPANEGKTVTVKGKLVALFRHNAAPRVLRFLDEATTPGENLVMVPSLPPRLLLQSARTIGMLGRI